MNFDKDSPISAPNPSSSEEEEEEEHKSSYWCREQLQLQTSP
jgi:hypothetical protein